MKVISLILQSSMEGAQTSIYCSVTKNIEKLNGEHFKDCYVVKKYQSASDPSLSEKVWEETKVILKLD